MIRLLVASFACFQFPPGHTINKLTVECQEVKQKAFLSEDVEAVMLDPNQPATTTDVAPLLLLTADRPPGFLNLLALRD